jgi:hypothetical protein
LKFPVEYKKCPDCGCEETLAVEAQKAVVLSMKEAPKTFMYYDQKAIPLVSDQNLSGNFKPILVQYFDYCAGCGRYRMVKAELFQQPKPTNITTVPGGMIPKGRG